MWHSYSSPIFYILSNNISVYSQSKSQNTDKINIKHKKSLESVKFEYQKIFRMS